MLLAKHEHFDVHQPTPKKCYFCFFSWQLAQYSSVFILIEWMMNLNTDQIPEQMLKALLDTNIFIHTQKCLILNPNNISSSIINSVTTMGSIIYSLLAMSFILLTRSPDYELIPWVRVARVTSMRFINSLLFFDSILFDNYRIVFLTQTNRQGWHFGISWVYHGRLKIRDTMSILWFT